jgi:hypothetical protein
MPHIKQKVLAIDKINVAGIGIRPAGGPSLPNLETVATIQEARVACHDGHVLDGKVMLTPEVLVKMCIGNAPDLSSPLGMGNMLFMRHVLLVGNVPLFGVPFFMRLVPLFLVDLFSFFVFVVVLGRSRNCTCQEERRRNSNDDCESLHIPS